MIIKLCQCDRCGSPAPMGYKTNEGIFEPHYEIVSIYKMGMKRELDLCKRCQSDFLEWLRGNEE